MTPSPPVALLAELTYRCPLRCGYCSNPTDWRSFSPELETSDWARVFAQASALGVLHAHLSGGEPLLRDDLEAIVSSARSSGLYVNLITSAWGLTNERIVRLAEAGVDHVQVSIQDVDASIADALAGTTAHAQKLAAARAVTAAGMALSINIVLHRQNLDRIAEVIDLAESLGAQRLELANTQFHGSALAHRAALMPTWEQLAHGRDVALAARERLRGRMDILWVLPDHYTDSPKPCMDGWGRRFITVIPNGTVLPCAAAHGIPGMVLDSVRHQSLADIWNDGRDFQRFRGTSWMQEPCASCDQRDIDHGGCRCQAFALTGDAAATDPACGKSPLHDLVVRARTTAKPQGATEVLYRLDATRQRSSG